MLCSKILLGEKRKDAAMIVNLDITIHFLGQSANKDSFQ